MQAIFNSNWLRAALLASSTLGGCFVVTAAYAVDAGGQSDTIEEVVVTAQKREQSLQDVPIAITALTPEVLQANRIFNVMDIATLVPDLSVRPAAGGVDIPSFTMRGLVSYGVVPGTDKEISIYLDGVYLGNSQGGAFDLPNIERIEVLKGPQGTLFGRNATGGAVSITTQDPAGEFGLRQQVTFGNYDQVRSSTQLELPAYKDFSAAITYVHTSRQGDIENLGAGTLWDYSGPGTNRGIEASPKYLGNQDENSFFVSVKYEPSDNFKTVYKFDFAQDLGSPEGVGSLGVNPNSAIIPAAQRPFLVTIFAANAAANPSLLNVYPTRPKAVNNDFTTDSFSQNWGHSLTSTWSLSDSMQFKNVASYRYSYNTSSYELDGLGGLEALPFLSDPLVAFGVSTQGLSKQWSDELQFNYNTHWLTLTTGAIYFDDLSFTGIPGQANNFEFQLFTPESGSPGPGAVYGIPSGQEASTKSRTMSAAGYAQAEFHITDQLDIIAGGRMTRDAKSGSAETTGAPFVSFTYDKVEPAYTLDVNYKPQENVLLYAKYSRSYVSGGQAALLAFKPEIAGSWEVGEKGDFFDHTVRANIALYDATYHDLQDAASGESGVQINPELAYFATIVLPGGNATARGFELDTDWVPLHGLTLSANLAYTDFELTYINPAIEFEGVYAPIDRSKWTSTLTGQYDTDPLFGQAYAYFRMDASYHSKYLLNSYAAVQPTFVNYSPASWIVNSRLALTNLEIGGHTAEAAFWVKNLTDNGAPLFCDAIYFVSGTSYQPARTYGIDLTFNW